MRTRRVLKGRASALTSGSASGHLMAFVMEKQTAGMGVMNSTALTIHALEGALNVMMDCSVLMRSTGKTY